MYRSTIGTVDLTYAKPICPKEEVIFMKTNSKGCKKLFNFGKINDKKFGNLDFLIGV